LRALHQFRRKHRITTKAVNQQAIPKVTDFPQQPDGTTAQ